MVHGVGLGAVHDVALDAVHDEELEQFLHALGYVDCHVELVRVALLACLRVFYYGVAIFLLYQNNDRSLHVVLVSEE